MNWVRFPIMQYFLLSSLCGSWYSTARKNAKGNLLLRLWKVGTDHVIFSCSWGPNLSVAYLLSILSFKPSFFFGRWKMCLKNARSRSQLTIKHNYLCNHAHVPITEPLFLKPCTKELFTHCAHMRTAETVIDFTSNDSHLSTQLLKCSIIPFLPTTCNAASLYKCIR